MSAALKVKVCGMRSIANIEALCQLPIDYMGLIFYPRSKRFVNDHSPADIEQIIQLSEAASIQRVGVMVDASPSEIEEKVAQYQLQVLQLHGKESPQVCAEFKDKGVKIIKVFSVGGDFDFRDLAAYEPHCDYFLFDTKGPLPGGNGYTFDWTVLDQYKGKLPFFLSGGIRPNMADRIAALNWQQLHAIDLNSGFERAPADKNIEQLTAFLRQVLKGTSFTSNAT